MADHVAPKKEYYIVFALLMVLMTLTVVMAQVAGLGVFGTFIAYLIASIKGLLIILYFMHVRYSSRLTWVFAAASFLWVGILLALTFNDYLTRGRLTRADPMTVRLDRRPGPAHPGDNKVHD